MTVITNAVNALKKLRALSYEEFAAEHVLVSSAERDFQVAIQAAIDIGAILLSAQAVTVPNSYKALLLALGDMGVLPSDFAQKIAPMAQFRNVLVHLYLEVDVRKVYQYIQYNLEDIELFVQYVGTYIHQGEGDDKTK